jgi:hypothetical protein
MIQKIMLALAVKESLPSKETYVRKMMGIGMWPAAREPYLAFFRVVASSPNPSTYFL